MKRMMRRSLVAMMMAGCATAPPLEEHQLVPAEPAQPKEALGLAPGPGDGPADYKAIAREAVSPRECVENAKVMRDRSPSAGWALLTACIHQARFPRGSFTDIRLVLDGTWDDDWRTRPDAPDLVMELLARRGGDIYSDLLPFQEIRVPIFSLKAAMAQPDTYRHRLLIVHARVDGGRNAAGTASTELSEMTLLSQLHRYSGEGEVQVHDSSYSRQSQGTYNMNTTGNYGNGSMSGVGTGANSGNSRSETYTQENHYTNELSETGLKAIGHLKQPDPFLEVGRDYLFLVRFDGTRTSGDAEEGQAVDTLGVLTVVSYVRNGELVSR